MWWHYISVFTFYRTWLPYQLQLVCFTSLMSVWDVWVYMCILHFSEKTGKAWVWGLTSCGGTHPVAIDKILFLHFYQEEEKVNKGFSLPLQQTVGVGDSMQGEISFTMTSKKERKFIQHFLILFSCSTFKHYELLSPGCLTRMDIFDQIKMHHLWSNRWS